LLGNLTVGVGAKILHEDIEDYTSSGFALDGGLLYTPSRGITVGLGLMNVGVASAFDEERDPLPLLVKFSAAWKGLESDYGQLVAAVDVDYLPGNLPKPAFGLEYWGGRYFALRAGYAVKETDLSQLIGFATGIGVRYKALRIDYAFAPFSTLGTTHRVTMNWEIWPLVSLPIPGSVVGTLRTVS